MRIFRIIGAAALFAGFAWAYSRGVWHFGAACTIWAVLFVLLSTWLVLAQRNGKAAWDFLALPGLGCLLLYLNIYFTYVLLYWEQVRPQNLVLFFEEFGNPALMTFFLLVCTLYLGAINALWPRRAIQ